MIILTVLHLICTDRSLNTALMMRHNLTFYKKQELEATNQQHVKTTASRVFHMKEARNVFNQKEGWAVDHRLSS